MDKICGCCNESIITATTKKLFEKRGKTKETKNQKLSKKNHKDTLNIYLFIYC